MLLAELPQGLDGKHSVLDKPFAAFVWHKHAFQLSNAGVIFCTKGIIKCLSLYVHLNLFFFVAK